MRIGVIGGGIFGSVAALEFAQSGHEVTVFEASNSLISRASAVNQARLHTGMHYPRDYDTALSARNDHDDFAGYFRQAIQPVQQHYAIGHNSNVGFEDFLSFGERIGNSPKVVEAGQWFRKGVVAGVLKVEESSIDFPILRDLLEQKLSKSGARVRLSDPVIGLTDGESPSIETNALRFEFDRVVVATYALAQRFANEVDISFPPMKTQVTEVVLGKISALEGTGITLMDGPFWSTMPFGQSKLHSLTSVPYTPLIETTSGQLTCQSLHGNCGKVALDDCNGCAFLPGSNAKKIVSQFLGDVKEHIEFTESHSLFAVKSLPTGPYYENTAARPSHTYYSNTGNIVVVHSGKIGSSLPLARALVSNLG